jgi:hypothetical protein
MKRTKLFGRRMETEIEAEPLRCKQDVASPLANLLNALPQEPPLSQIALARVHRRVLKTARAPRRGAVRGLRWATMVALLMLGATAGVAGTMVGVRWLRPATQAVSDPPASASPNVQPQRRRTRVAPVAPPVVEPAVAPEALPAEQPQPAAQVPRPRAVVRAPLASASGVAPAAIEPEPAPSALAMASTPLQEEARLVASALGALRGGQRTQAIAQLQGYLRSHPAGAFVEEAHVALVTAFVDGKQHDQARRLLEQSQGQFASSPTLQLLQAELSFDADCEVAKARLEQLVNVSGLPQAARERVAYGAAMAQWRCGTRSLGQARLERFLVEFPNSRRVENVRQHLQNKL